MANSILGAQRSSPEISGINPQMIQKLNEFQQAYKGDPKQAVMQMLRQGKINNAQLQQAIQMARQIQNMIK